MPMQGSFDAAGVKPFQFGDKHPIGRFPFQISNTSITPTKDNSGGMFVVEFTTPAGVISNRYNLWNQSEKAVEISQGQLSALCHATGIFRLDWTNDGAALRGGRGVLDVALQKGEEPDGFVEVKKVYDSNGNEPGKGPAPAAPQPQQQQAPQQQPQPNPNPAANNGGMPAVGWGNAQNGQNTPMQNASQANNAGGWTQQQPSGSSGGAPNPPWATK